MQPIRGVATLDGRGHLSTGTSGDLMLFCNNCRDTRDPIAEISATECGPCVHCKSHRHQSGVWATTLGVKVTCGRCGECVAILFTQLSPLLDQIAGRISVTAPAQVKQ